LDIFVWDTIINWKEEIVKLVYVKQDLAAADVTGLWPQHLPSFAESNSEISQAENAIGFKLDLQYIDFLLHANEWDGFYQTVDLFGTKDLIASERFNYATKMLDALDDSAVLASGFQRDVLFPTAVTTQDKDIFLMEKSNTRVTSRVVWFSGGFVEKHSNFEEIFLAMIDYNREEVAYFQRGK